MTRTQQYLILNKFRPRDYDGAQLVLAPEDSCWEKSRAQGFEDQVLSVLLVAPDRYDLDTFHGPHCDSGSPRDSPGFLLR